MLDHFAIESSGQYLVSSFVDGVDLQTLLNQYGRLPHDPLIEWLQAACQPLTYLHQKGQLHLNIKPANIRLTPNGDVFLVDSGLPGLGVHLHDTGYGSPEQQAQNEELVQARDQLLRLQRTFAFMQQWGWLLWLLPFSCLLLITLLAVRSWSEWGLWWGWPMAGTAVIVLFISLIFPAITTLLLRQLPADPTVLAGSVQLTGVRMVTAVTDTWLNRVNVQAAIMFVVGILFLLLGFVTRKREANW